MEERRTIVVVVVLVVVGAAVGAFFVGRGSSDGAATVTRAAPSVPVTRGSYADGFSAGREAAFCLHIGRMGDPGLEPGTSSLSEKRSNRLS